MQDKRRWLPSWQRVELVELCLERGFTRRQAAAWRRVSVSTVQYWIGRYRSASDAERASGAWARDRPSTPCRQPARVSAEVHDRVCEARERTGWGPRLIAAELGMAHATVSRCLVRRGLSRRPVAPREAVRRYEWPCPGELLQMDTKRLGRFSRPGQRRDRRSVPHRRREARRRRLGVLSLDDRRPHPPGLRRSPPRREGADRRSRSCDARSRSSPPTASPPSACSPTTARPTAQPCTRSPARALGIRHLRTRPRRPQTNGKACVLASGGRPAGRRGSPRPVV